MGFDVIDLKISRKSLSCDGTSKPNGRLTNMMTAAKR